MGSWESQTRRGRRLAGKPARRSAGSRRRGPPGTLQVTPEGGFAGPAQQGQPLALDDLLSAFPGVAAKFQLARPSSVGKKALLVEIEPQSGAAPIVSIDRVGATLNVSING